MANTKQQYADCKRKGELGEQACYSLCRAITSQFTNIIDTRDIKKYRDADIDFVIQSPFSDLVFIEAKYAGIDGGADVFETEKNMTTGAAGWAIGSKAHYVTIYKEPMNEIHIIDMNKCRPFISSNLNNPRYKHYYKQTYSNYNNGQILYYTDNIRVPYADLKANGIIAAIFSYKKNFWEQTYIDQHR